MKTSYKKSGFSLTEVLLSIGVLAIGMIFVAGVFPVGIYFTTVSTERTIAAVVADEAFAKIRLYADPDPYNNSDDIDLRELSVNQLRDFNDVFNDQLPPAAPVTRRLYPYVDVFAYPSDFHTPAEQKTYYWSALCRLTKAPILYPNQRLVQVTVFVCRKAGAGEKYWYRNPANPNQLLQVDYPKPFNVSVLPGNKPDELIIEPKIFTYGGYSIEQKTFINDGCTIVDNATGRLYRVLERYAYDPEQAGRDQTILLDRPWKPCATCPQQIVWVIPPPVDGGRNPCIAVYQKVIRF